MVIGSNFIFVDTMALFNARKNNNEFKSTAMVFIKETHQIWNHGEFFPSTESIQAAQIWQQNTTDQNGYVLASGTRKGIFWGVPSGGGGPQWIDLSTLNIDISNSITGVLDTDHGGTGKDTASWLDDLQESTIKDIVLVEKNVQEDSVSFSTLGTTGISNPDVTQILINSSEGIKWADPEGVHVGSATNASTADQLNHKLAINGYLYDGSADIDAGVIDIYYGGTSKTIVQHNGTEVNAWFKELDFPVGYTSEISRLVSVNGYSDGQGNVDAQFDTISVPIPPSGVNLALTSTANGFDWFDLSSLATAFRSMVFKGGVNCSRLEGAPSDVEAKVLPWYEAEIGWTYICVDESFEVTLPNLPTSYGVANVGDLIICKTAGELNTPAEWTLVNNKITNSVTYAGDEERLWILNYPEGTGTQADFVAVSNGRTPTQIKYNPDLWIDNDGWLHGKFYVEAQRGGIQESKEYVKFTAAEAIVNFTSAYGATATSVAVNLSNNNYAVRIGLDEIGTLYYADPALWDINATGSHTIYQIYEIAEQGGNYWSATKLQYSTITQMANNTTKQIAIVCLGINDGYIGGTGTKVKLISHPEYRDATTTMGNWLYSGSQDSGLTNDVSSKVAANPELRLTLKKVAGGYTIMNKDGLFLNTESNDDSASPLMGGSVYNPIYIDAEGMTRSTDLYSYNVLKNYTSYIDSSWTENSRNQKFDEVYNTYQVGEEVAGYGKNLVIPVTSVNRLINDGDTVTRLGAILQWGNKTQNTNNIVQLFGDVTRNEFFIRSKSSEWHEWKKFVFADDIDGFVTIEQYEDDELVIATALTNLDDRVSLLEENQGQVGDLSDEYVTVTQYQSDEQVEADAFNVINSRLLALENGDNHTSILNQISALNTRIVTLENSTAVSDLDAALSGRIDGLDVRIDALENNTHSYTFTAATGSHINQPGTPTVVATTVGDATTLTFDYLGGTNGKSSYITNLTNLTDASTSISNTNIVGYSAANPMQIGDIIFAVKSGGRVYRVTAVSASTSTISFVGRIGSDANLATTTKAYLTGTTLTANGYYDHLYFDTGCYLDTAAGRLTAGSFSTGNIYTNNNTSYYVKDVNGVQYSTITMNASATPYLHIGYGTFAATTPIDTILSGKNVVIRTNTASSPKNCTFNNTGTLTLGADPTANMHAVTKQYADGKLDGLSIKKVSTLPSSPDANTIYIII